MTNMSMKFKQDFLREFREDPKNSLKKYGIDFSPQEEANFKKEEIYSLVTEAKPALVAFLTMVSACACDCDSLCPCF